MLRMKLYVGYASTLMMVHVRPAIVQAMNALYVVLN